MKQLYIKISIAVTVCLSIILSLTSLIFNQQKNNHEKIFEEYALALGLKEIQVRLNRVPVENLYYALKVEQQYINAKLEIKRQNEIQEELEWDKDRRFKCECKRKEKTHVFDKTYYFPLYENQMHQGKFYLHIIPNVNPKLPHPPFNSMIFAFMITMFSVFVISVILLYPWRQRILKINWIVNQLEQGDLSVRIDDQNKDILGLLGKSFDKMATRLQSEIKAREDLIQATAHELGHPLSRMKLNLAFLEMSYPIEKFINGELKLSDYLNQSEEIIKKEAQSHIKRIRSVEEDMDLLEDLMQELVYFLEAGNQRLERKTFALKHLAQIAESLAEEYQKEIIFYTNLNPNEYLIDADPKLFSRVIENLLRNAIVYAKSKIIVEAIKIDDLKQIHIKNHPNDQNRFTLKVEVRDDGAGIPEADRERVLEPFVRLDPSRDRKLGGFGLGLSIVSKIMILHGSQLEIETAKEGGAQLNTYWLLRKS
jgi:two-component system sensor histidine kinase RstB